MEVLLILLLMVGGVLWYVCRGELAERRSAEKAWLREAVISEAESVIMDFLDYGREIAKATGGKYRGTVSVRLHPMEKNGGMGFLISMYDTGDLARLNEKTVERCHLQRFVKTYGFYYDPERDAIVYPTSRSVLLSLEERTEIQKRLIKRIGNHPNAIVKSDTLIGTRGI